MPQVKHKYQTLGMSKHWIIIVHNITMSFYEHPSKTTTFTVM